MKHYQEGVVKGVPDHVSQQGKKETTFLKKQLYVSRKTWMQDLCLNDENVRQPPKGLRRSVAKPACQFGYAMQI